MKKSILLILVGILTFQLANAQEYYTKEVSQIPANSKTFLDQHFANHSISYILIDREFTSTDYEVVLNGGYEIKFDQNGEWKEIEAKRIALPDSAIPPIVLNYVKTSFPDSSIEKIERKSWGYEVELLNGLELKMDKQGRLLKIDD